jgi:hypothetical protein
MKAYIIGFLHKESLCIEAAGIYSERAASITCHMDFMPLELHVERAPTFSEAAKQAEEWCRGECGKASEYFMGDKLRAMVLDPEATPQHFIAAEKRRKAMLEWSGHYGG